jgi:hypothetical protein
MGHQKWVILAFGLKIAAKATKIQFGRCDKPVALAAADKLEADGVQGMVREDEAGALGVGQAVFDEGQV